MKVYIAINSSKIGSNEIASIIKDNLSRTINIGDKKTYSTALYDYNSCEYSFYPKSCLISDTIDLITNFIDKNIMNFQILHKMDDSLAISLRFIIELDGESTPDSFFNSQFLFLLSQIKADLDIDMYYK
ncbi:hypothetical protein AGMMS50239_41300 [Bacteroidia bacterium]|nr:hypothetical protein AGMMS50239_41300 [Bacteroidia bacterium]